MDDDMVAHPIKASSAHCANIGWLCGCSSQRRTYGNRQRLNFLCAKTPERNLQSLARRSAKLLATFIQHVRDIYDFTSRESSAPLPGL